jgi:hypothetical protein
MKTKQIIAGISAAAVLAMVTPAYAGLLGGGAGAVGGSMTNGIGGMTGQSAFDGRGAASTSFERFPERPMPRAKPATTGAESAQRSGGGTAKAVSGSAEHQADGSAFTALGQASGQSSSATNAAAQLPSRAASTTGSTAGSTAGSASTPATTAPATTAPTPAPRTPSPIAASPSAPPAAMTSATGAGSVDAQHSRGDNSVAVSGGTSGSVSRTE